MSPAARAAVVGGFLLSTMTLSAQRAISIDEATRLALATSQELRMAQVRVQASARAWSLGFRAYFPTVSVSANDMRSVLMNAPDTSSTSWSLTIDQTLFDGGRQSRQRALSRMQVLLGRRAEADQRDALVDAVRALFRKVLVQRQSLRIQENARSVTEDQLVISRMERQIGSIRDVDLLDSELELGAVELEAQDTRAALAESEFQLRRLLGLQAREACGLEGEIDASYAGIEIPEAESFFYDIAYANNASLAAQELEIRKAQEDVRDAAAWFVPSLSFQLSLSLAGEDYPLQNASLAGKLLLGFPFRAFPLSASLSASSTPGRETSAGSDGEVSVLEDLGAWTDRTVAALSYRASLLKRDQLREDLRFSIAQETARQTQRMRGLALKRRQIELSEMKAAIMARQLELGEVKRIDHVRAQTQLARDRTALLADVLQMLDGERSFEKLLGVRPGELAGLCRKALEEVPP
jgi:outer membrane protein TolC